MMETTFLNEANKFPSGELVATRDELLIWQDKYRRLYEAHRRVQRVNQGLEDKLLKLVDACETEKTTLTKDVATLSHKLAEANYTIKKLTEDNERYKNDVSLAIQFLQCKQSNFVAHKFDSLPQEVQSQVSNYMTTKKKPEEKKSSSEVKNIKVPIPTFPPTAMVYSVPKSPNLERKAEEDLESPPVDIVSAAIMAKVLEERQRERALAKHCDTCTCARNLKIIYDETHHCVGTQTGDYKEMLCLRCNENMQSTSTSMKIVRTGNSNAQKLVPIYPLENVETSVATQTNNNIVKVQPNNFLLDNKSKSNSINSSLVELTTPNDSPKNMNNPTSTVIYEKETIQDMNFSKVKQKLKHHRLCEQSVLTNNSIFEPEAATETIVDETGGKENSKGPRYCSMRVQTGTRNILLDNAQSSISPILYTRNNKTKQETPAQVIIDSSNTETSNESRLVSTYSENSPQNQQRVAEWIQNNLEDDVSSSENSKSEPLRGKSEVVLDKSRYKEMEDNVKRFLFGESEFLKTVELGKLKYQNLREGEVKSKGSNADSNI